MFTLDELEKTSNYYRYNISTRRLKNCSNSSAKMADDLSQEERNRIISALYLDELVFNFAYRKKDNNPQGLLDEIQTKFYQAVLIPNNKFVSSTNIDCSSIIDELLADLTTPDEDLNHMPEIYMQYILNENGKKATNIHREVESNGKVYSIQYDIEDLDKRKAFQKSLDANHPQYVQPVQKVELSPEERKNRRRFAEKNMQYYNITESHQYRVESEKQYMQQVAYIVNNYEQIAPINSVSELFCLLNAAQNLTLDYGKDFLEELLSQPEVDKALLNFKSLGYATVLKKRALSIQKEIQECKEYSKDLKAKIECTPEIKIYLESSLKENEDRLHLLKKPLTPGEADRMAANECLANSHEEPDSLLIQAKTLRTIPSNATDATSLTRSEKGLISLIRVAMRQDGMQPGNIKIGNGAISIEEQENQNIL